MSEKNEYIAESIIRCEGFTFALACLPNQSLGNLQEARRLLKDRLLKELELAEYRGSHP